MPVVLFRWMFYPGRGSGWSDGSDKGFHAGMNYMANNIEKRENPALLVEGACSVIVTLTNYYTPKLQSEGIPVVARYAYGKDYHRVVKDRLFKLHTCLEEVTGRKITGRAFVDSAPVFEHEWARRARVGMDWTELFVDSSSFGVLLFYWCYYIGF